MMLTRQQSPMADHNLTVNMTIMLPRKQVSDRSDSGSQFLMETDISGWPQSDSQLDDNVRWEKGMHDRPEPGSKVFNCNNVDKVTMQPEPMADLSLTAKLMIILP
jgi:hypothetical protein